MVLIFALFFFLAFLVSPEFKYDRVCADQNNPFSCQDKWKIDYKKVRFLGGASIIKFAVTGKPIGSNGDYVPVVGITLASSTIMALILSFVTIRIVNNIRHSKHSVQKNDKKEE